MNGKKLGAGCSGVAGLAMLGFCLVMLVSASDGLAGALCFAPFALGPLVLAWSLWRSARSDEQTRNERLQEQRERQILAVAARHDGSVTPALVAMHSVDFSIVTAKQMLDQLASVGLCAVEADEEGGLHYVFDLSGRPKPELSPEEWVAGRMTGEIADADLSALDDAD